MQVQSINNYSGPNFGYLNIETSRGFVKYLGKYEKEHGVDIKRMISLLTATLEYTKYLHVNLSYEKNKTSNKIPKMHVIMSRNFKFPDNGKYKITNKDGSTEIYKITGFGSSLYIFEDNLEIEKSLILCNGYIEDENRIFDIVNDFDNDKKTNNNNEYFPIPNGELFVKQIINADNILQAFEEGRAICLDEECTEPYRYSPYIQSGYNEFISLYNRIFPEFRHIPNP